ncbi:MAG TPA: cytochrome c oxidase subunit 3 [Cyclobacteriaceae bacterium]
MNPKKFGMWLFLVSVVMVFASITSAYIVRRADGNWTHFEMPMLFWMTSVIILLSSVTMQWAYLAAKKDNLSTAKLMTTLTFILGVAFLVGQFYGWKDLVTERVFLVGNPSGSFVYIITGLHGLHIVSALIYLLIVLLAVRAGKVHPGRLLSIELCTTYWHFLGVLWLYLFVFLLLTR